MAGRENLLKARLKVMGGDQVAAVFDKVGRHGKAGFDLVSKEAKDAAKDVEKLRDEIARLDRIAKTIYAKIDVNREGGLSAADLKRQSAVSAIENQIAQLSSRLGPAGSLLEIDGGRMARTFNEGFAEGIDLFGNRAARDAIEALDLKDVLDPKELKELDGALGRIDKRVDGIRDKLATRIASKDEAAALKAEVDAIEAADNARQQAAAQAEADRLDAARRQKRADELAAKAHEAIEDRKRSRQEQADLRRRKAEEGHERWLAHRREQRITDEARLIEEINADSEARNRAAAEEADYQRKKAAADEKQADADILAARQRAEREYERRRRAERSAPAAPRVDTPDHDPVSSRKKDWLDDLDVLAKRWDDFFDGIGRKAAPAVKTLDSFSRAVGRITNATSKATAKPVINIISGIAGAAKDSLGDLRRFTAALNQFEYALGNVALRTGVAGIIAAIGVALAGIGGAAVMGGIGAFAGVAAWDATKLARLAESLNTPLDAFTELQFAAQMKGIPFDAYASSLTDMRQKLLAIVKGEDDLAKAVAKRHNIPIFSLDGNDVAEFERVLPAIVDAYNKIGSPIVRQEFLSMFGLGALEDLIKENHDGIRALKAEARRIGVSLDPADVAAWESLDAAIWRMWNVLKGIGYGLAREIMPDLLPVMEAISNWAVNSQGQIIGSLVSTFNYLLQVTKDFWRLYNNQDDLVVKQWTAQVWYFGEVVVETFANVWGAVRRAYDFLHPALQAIGELIYGEDDKNAGLKLTLTAIGGQLLGITALVTSFVRTITAGFGLVGGAATRFLVPILGTVAGIVGWPIALAAGAGLVWAYWDDISAAVGRAWAYFKTTFPQAAAFLEDAFGQAKTVVTDFADSAWQSFSTRWPQLADTILSVRDRIVELATDLSQLDWASAFSFGLDTVKASMSALLDVLELMMPTVRELAGYLTENFVQSVKVIASWIHWGGEKVGEFGEWAGNGDAAVAERMRNSYDMTPEQLRQETAGLREAYALFYSMQQRGLAQPQAHWDPIESYGPADVSRHAPEPVLSGTPVVLDLGNGVRETLISTDPGQGQRLLQHHRARAGSRPSWETR